MGLTEKLLAHYPGAAWSLSGEDYEGLDWYGPGDKPTEADLQALDEPEPVPDEVSNFQGRTILRHIGLFAEVEAAINAIPDETERAMAQDAFARGAFRRKSELIARIQSDLKISDALADDLFRQAAQITF